MPPLLTATTDRDPLSYRVGEPVRFLFRAEGAPPGAIIRWRRTGDDGAEAGGTIPASCPVPAAQGAGSAPALQSADSAPAAQSAGCAPAAQGAGCAPALQSAGCSVPGTAVPGFLRLEADLLAPGGGAALAHFEGGAGADVAAIRADTPEPPDFDSFWTRRKAALAAVPFDGATLRPIASPREGVRLCEVSIPCPGGRPSTGMLAVPAAPGRYPARVRFRGYFASWKTIGHDTPKPEEIPDDALTLFLSAHGYDFNREPAYYERLHDSLRSNGFDVGFDPEQNARPGTSYFGGVVWRVLRGLEFLKRRPEWNGRDLTVLGGSLGGAQAIWAAALDHDVTECRPRIPWCCNMAGSAHGRAHGDWFVPWSPGLAYYDAVNMARRIPGTCRVCIPQAGLGDYISPPSGVMAFYNALSCEKSATFIQGATHFDFPSARSQVVTLHAP